MKGRAASQRTQPRRWTRLLAVLVVCTLGIAHSPRASAQVLLVLSDESAGYQALSDEFRGGLGGVRSGRLRIDSTVAARIAAVDEKTFAAYELVVTVGLSAAQSVVARDGGMANPPRTLCLLIPRQSFDHLAPPSAAGHVSALFIDQPLARQFDLLRLALPERKRVGVILGPSSRDLAGELRDQAHARAIELSSVPIENGAGLYAAMQTVTASSDLLLMLPDPVATNADLVYGMLLTAYRAELPVVGFSEGLLNAGALVSLYSTARQQGKQGAEIAAQALAPGAALPAPQFPRYFTVRVNASVARSLGLHLPSDDALAAQLREREAARGGEARDAKPSTEAVPAIHGGTP